MLERRLRSLAADLVSFYARAVPGKSVPFSIEQDGYVRIRLEDGSLLRARPVIVDVRTTDERSEGRPVYVVQSFVHVVIEEAGEKEGDHG